MDFTLIYVMAAVMAGAGLWFLYLLLGRSGRRRPADAIEWAGTVLSVLLVAAAGFLVALTFQTGPAPGPVDADGYPTLAEDELGEQAPNFTFRRVSDGTEMELEELRGNVVLINFWATWCAPCLTELPDLNMLAEEYRDEGLVVLTVSDEPRDELTAFEAELPLKTLSGYVGGVLDLPEPYSRTIAIRPNSYIIDRGGVIREYVLGAQDRATFERLVRPYLETESGS